MTNDHLTHYHEARPRLLSLAYRMTGSLSDSEDILQDAWLRFAQVPAETVGSAAALLTTIVTRLCLDLLRSARKKRETYVGPWLPEPIPDLYLAHEDATQRETVSYAFLLLLQKLQPVERAVFILREIFDYDYAEIAKTVRKSADHCRQIFHRSKKALRSEYTARPQAGAHERELTGSISCGLQRR
jgi:RNA polymerase sigma-70 factor (ECF subfamily)